MSNFIITCDSTVDLPLKYLVDRDIYHVALQYDMNGVTRSDDFGTSVRFEDFYQMIREGAMPTTSQVNIIQYYELFAPFVKEGKAVLHIGFSSALSGSFNSAIIARAQLLETYPQARITLVDSLCASSGHGMLVDLVADKRDEGMSFEEAAAFAEEMKMHIQHWFFTTDLSHLKRGGRISPAAAMIGGLLNICPLMQVNEVGKLVPVQKVRGKKKVIEEIVKVMEENAQDGVNYAGKVFLSHSDVQADAEAVIQRIRERFKNIQEPILLNWVGTVIGAHTGPGTVALFYVGKQRGAS